MAICLTISIYHHSRPGNDLVATWDVYGYYLYLPGAFTFGDLERFDFAEGHFADYPMASGLYQLQEVENGNRVPIYTMGLAMAWSPFYLVAEGINAIGGVERDGMRPVNQWSLIFAAFVFALLGLLCLRRFLLEFFTDRFTALLVLAVVFGTNYFYYLCFSPGMPHAYAFAGHAAVLYLSHRWFREYKPVHLYLMAFIIALLCLIRPSEAIVVLIPLVYALRNGFKGIGTSRLIRQVGIAAGVAVLPVLLQVFFWKFNTGHWIYNAYSEGGHRFFFDGRFLFDGLFSYRKGWFVYTPLMLLAVIGLAFSRNILKKWWLPLLVVLVAHTWLTFSWHMWWYANSFGARPMIHIYPELITGLGAGIALLGRRRWVLAIVLAVVTMLTALNLFQTWQYNRGILPGDYTTGDYYWMAFGKTELDRSNLKYLFSHREPREAQWEVIAEGVPEGSTPDSAFAQVLTAGEEYSFVVSSTMSEAAIELYDSRWYRLSADIEINGNRFDADRQALMVFEGRRNGESIFWHSVPVQIFTPVDSLVQTKWCYRTQQDIQPGDELRLLIWNQSSPDTLNLHRMRIETIR